MITSRLSADEQLADRAPTIVPIVQRCKDLNSGPMMNAVTSKLRKMSPLWQLVTLLVEGLIRTGFFYLIRQRKIYVHLNGMEFSMETNCCS